MLRLICAGLLLATACHGSEPSRFPERKAGCDVQVFHDAPTVQTESVGTVRASCDDFVSVSECTRTLLDEACKLGADVVWAVSDPPLKENGKIKLTGHAAHTK